MVTTKASKTFVDILVGGIILGVIVYFINSNAGLNMEPVTNSNNDTSDKTSVDSTDVLDSVPQANDTTPAVINLADYSYVFVPDTFTLNLEQTSQMFTLLEEGRVNFNANVPPGTRRPAHALSEYMLAIGESRPVSESSSLVIKVLAVPREWEQSDPQWYKTLPDKDGYLLGHVRDGGNQYFEADIDLTNNTVTSFSTNGES